MRLVCVRHLPTEWNLRGLLQGQRDTALVEPDAASLEAIRENREKLNAHGPFDVVLSSTLRRTRDTASHYGYPDAVPDPLLDELAFGRFEGKLRSLLEAEVPEWLKDPRALTLGESLADLDARIRQFLRKYAAHRRVLVFGHGSWMRALVSIARYGDVRGMNRFFIENSAIHTSEVDGDSVREGGMILRT